MSTTTELGRSTVSLGGFIAGAIIGGSLFWTIGYRAVIVHSGSGSLVWEFLFFVSVLAFVFSIVSPLALVLFIGRNRDSQVKRELVTVGGYAAAFAFVVGLGFLGVFVLQDLGIDSPAEGIVFLDAVFGFTFGGIAGTLLVRRWSRQRRARRARRV